MTMDINIQEFLQKLKDIGKWNEDFDYSELIFKKKHNKSDY